LIRIYCAGVICAPGLKYAKTDSADDADARG